MFYKDSSNGENEYSIIKLFKKSLIINDGYLEKSYKVLDAKEKEILLKELQAEISMG